MLVASLLLAAMSSAAAEPVKLHPDNPHYFQFRGKPAVLLTSGEHYGAVLNLDFDFRPYLDELKRCGFNLTRTFSGTYREVPGSFKIHGNTLAPREGRYCCPWAQHKGKFNLDRFDDAYFRRLREFVTEAGRRGIVVEYVLFCPLYEEGLWNINPMNARNNVNGIGRIPRTEVFNLKHPELLKRQLAFIRKAVTELNTFDNVYFEICNEPYFGGVALDWQRRIADEIVAVERGLPQKHLIAQNIANGKAEVKNPHPAVSIFNFHYASPPDAVALNAALGKPIAFDETGFKGTGDRVYRRQAWEFLLAGGAVFSNLDYSFTADHENGGVTVKDPTPGGGGPALRQQLGFLKRFVEGFDLVHLQPTKAFIAKVEPRELGGEVQAMADRRSGAYAIYLAKGPHVRLTLKLPARGYRVRWMDPRDGRTLREEGIDAAGQAAKPVILSSPDYTEDIAARITPR
ncbi:MAG: hypothetical protein ACP5XB_11035 [Isosphaeraceae bacterium]